MTEVFEKLENQILIWKHLFPGLKEPFLNEKQKVLLAEDPQAKWLSVVFNGSLISGIDYEKESRKLIPVFKKYYHTVMVRNHGLCYWRSRETLTKWKDLWEEQGRPEENSVMILPIKEISLLDKKYQNGNYFAGVYEAFFAIMAFAIKPIELICNGDNSPEGAPAFRHNGEYFEFGIASGRALEGAFSLKIE